MVSCKKVSSNDSLTASGVNVQFSSLNLSGAKTLALVQNASVPYVGATKADGETIGQEQDTQPEFSIKAPLFSVYEDGTAVEVKYTISVNIEDPNGKEEEKILEANLRLLIGYIYSFDGKWLWLYDCNYDYPDFDTLEDGPLKKAVTTILSDPLAINQHFLVRLADGALFRLDRDKLPKLPASGIRSQQEMRGVVEEIGGNLYYIDEDMRLCGLVDKGNSLDLTQLLNDNVYNGFIMGSDAQALGIMPEYETGGSRTTGIPSVVFPLSKGITTIDGISAEDKSSQLVSTAEGLYVFKNIGDEIEEAVYPQSDVFLVVDGVEYPMMMMPEPYAIPADRADDFYRCGSNFTNPDNYRYAVYNCPVAAGAKVYVRSNGIRLGNGQAEDNYNADPRYYFFSSSLYGMNADNAEEPVCTVMESGNYEFYLLMHVHQSPTGEQYHTGLFHYSEEGESYALAYDDYYLRHSFPDHYLFVFIGFQRWICGDKIGLFKVNVSQNAASLADSPAITYRGNIPDYYNPSAGESSFDVRLRRFYEGEKINWIRRNDDGSVSFCSANVANGSYSEEQDTPYMQFPTNPDSYYDGLAYKMFDDNSGYYVYGLDHTVNFVSINYSELDSYRDKMSVQPANPIFLPALMAWKLTAFLLDGTSLAIYVDVTGPDTGKAKVYESSSTGAGSVLSALIRLN